jgi:hypothetical protein
MDGKMHYGASEEYSSVRLRCGRFVVHRYTPNHDTDRRLGYEGIVAACTTPEAQEAALRLLRIGTCSECGDARRVVASITKDNVHYCPCSLCGNKSEMSAYRSYMPVMAMIRAVSRPPVRLIDPVPCDACSSSGKYVDYAGPNVVGGRLVDCTKCSGRGWLERDASCAR